MTIAPPLESLTPIARGERSRAVDVTGALQAHLGDRPKDAHTWFALGVALNAQGRADEAVAALRAALALSPHNIGVECALAVALYSAGEISHGAALLEDVISRSPGDGWAYFHLGAMRFRQGRCEEAASLWECASRLLDDPVESLENLALALRRLGDAEGEGQCWRRIAEIEPDNAMAAHMLSASGLSPVPVRADDAYVRQLFDRFAPEFDRVLGVLKYGVPDRVGEWLARVAGPARASLEILDAGCGTGLCGVRARPWAWRLTGVDLSPGMLALARERGVYDELDRAELVSFVSSYQGKYNIIIAGDVLCYFGDLGPFARAALGALKPGGRLGFSVEQAHVNEAPEGFVLRPHGRYAHSRASIERLLPRAELTDVVLRYELAEPVRGWWVSVGA